MKKPQKAILTEPLSSELTRLGERIRRFRLARHLVQHEAAIRAGIARSTASRIESGDPSVAIGQVLRYIDAIAPGKSFDQLYRDDDPAEALLQHSERRVRARSLSEGRKKELDF
ncbi:helix-turn-helix domain-containing protein [Noviherbaspirillum malthae]|uniref:helix-turn-helix domain-containing protein n=1 Tax=Noviherbaspirillum malthae TaxID=1260987 RepID=UPI00188E02F5|nr:helix-turn-helix transcriptional regulator [Noviherbaspirillum malthae]